MRGVSALLTRLAGNRCDSKRLCLTISCACSSSYEPNREQGSGTGTVNGPIIRSRFPVPVPYSLFEPVLPQLLPQRRAVDAEHLGGLGLLVLAQLEHLEDVRTLELVEGGHVIACERLEHRARAGRARPGDVGDVEHVARSEDDGTLDRVLELAHVAGPRLRREVGDRCVGELDAAA